MVFGINCSPTGFDELILLNIIKFLKSKDSSQFAKALHLKPLLVNAIHAEPHVVSHIKPQLLVSLTLRYTTQLLPILLECELPELTRLVITGGFKEVSQGAGTSVDGDVEQEIRIIELLNARCPKLQHLQFEPVNACSSVYAVLDHIKNLQTLRARHTHREHGMRWPAGDTEEALVKLQFLDVTGCRHCGVCLTEKAKKLKKVSVTVFCELSAQVSQADKANISFKLLWPITLHVLENHEWHRLQSLSIEGGCFGTAPSKLAHIISDEKIFPRLYKLSVNLHQSKEALSDPIDGFVASLQDNDVIHTLKCFKRGRVDASYRTSIFSKLSNLRNLFILKSN